MLSTGSKGGIKQDFESEWQNLVVNEYGVKEVFQETETITENGWQMKSALGSFVFNNQNCAVLISTMSGYNKVVSIVSVTNSEDYSSDLENFFSSVEMGNPSIDFPMTQTTTAPPGNNKFAFNTTNFDDGWTSTVQEDWVEAAKGNIRVLIHYPNKQADTYNSVLLDGLKNAWNTLVAPKYSSAINIEFKPINGWQSIEFAEADLVEKLTGKTIYVVLFKMNYSNGSGKYLEFITPNKRSFEEEFGAYHESSYGWEKMENMANYNKFAVAASDLQGKWTNDFSGAIQYVNAYTGYDAGMATHASAENFQIGSGNTYNWDLGVASGQVGNIKFQSVKSNGEFSMTGNWQIVFSDMEGKPRTYNAYFSCIKGLRILWLDNRAFAKVQ
ncbi:MAG: hypothetical protein A3F91_12735 [Flavobacteria bacterium RIFCSPLOWO2_12_FULL_35_11]|nr:MAG: hypothetical protein A3F91_12735 [Flavobacteria bacterium RIFCSPLOWO2_12_FULL_35_11]